MKFFKKMLIGSTSLVLLAPAIAYSFSNGVSSKSNLKDIDLNKNYKSFNSKVKDTLIAQTDESGDSDTLKITVTGTRSPKPVDTFPGSIEVIDQENLSTKSGSTIKELTDDIPGVTVWPGPFGAIITTSTKLGGFINPNLMLNPCAKLITLPSLRLGSISLL